MLGQRKVRKKKSLGAHPDRDAQFETIAHLKAAYLGTGDPVISIDRYDPGSDEYGLALRRVDSAVPVSIGVRGDLVGVYCAM